MDNGLPHPPIDVDVLLLLGACEGPTEPVGVVSDLRVFGPSPDLLSVEVEVDTRPSAVCQAGFFPEHFLRNGSPDDGREGRFEEVLHAGRQVKHH